jgi:hypothetical protein
MGQNRPSVDDMDVDGNATVSLGDIPIDFSKLKKEHKQVCIFKLLLEL